MKNSIVVLFFISTLLGCQNQPAEKANLEGDLHYTWLKIGSFYNLPDSLYQSYIEHRDSIGIEELRKQDPRFTNQVELLKKHDLLKSPFIYLKTDSDSIFIIYMKPEDYKPITEYTYQDLIDNKQKVRLKLKTERLADGMLICKKVIAIEKVAGETFEKRGKFAIEDYK